VLSEDVKTTRRTPGDRVLCLIPSGFARRVVDLLDAHYAAADPAVDVVVDRRGGERRDHERRTNRLPPPGGVERRQNPDRRHAERRRPLEPVSGHELPRWARAYEGVIRFVRPRGSGRG
jgi:hypothetical protein